MKCVNKLSKLVYDASKLKEQVDWSLNPFLWLNTCIHHCFLYFPLPNTQLLSVAFFVKGWDQKYRQKYFRMFSLIVPGLGAFALEKKLFFLFFFFLNELLIVITDSLKWCCRLWQRLNKVKVSCRSFPVCSDLTHRFSLSSAEINLFPCPDKTTDNHEPCCTESVQDITPRNAWSLISRRTGAGRCGDSSVKSICWCEWLGAGSLIAGSWWHMISHTCLTQHIKIKEGTERNRAPWDAAYKCELCWKCNYLDCHKNHTPTDKTWTVQARWASHGRIVCPTIACKEICSVETINILTTNQLLPLISMGVYTDNVWTRGWKHCTLFSNYALLILLIGSS